MKSVSSVCCQCGLVQLEMKRIMFLTFYFEVRLLNLKSHTRLLMHFDTH